MTLAQLRKYILSLPGSTEEPHFERTSFRVKGRIFVTARPDEPYAHVFVGEELREPALAAHPQCMAKLPWGGKIVGLRIHLTRAPPGIVKDLVRAAWQARAPATPVAIDPRSTGARRLIALSDAHMTALYPAESNHFESPEALAEPHVRFLGIRAGEELIACGGVKLMAGDERYGEIKRVFVLPGHRGKGLARAIMAALEAQLRREGYLLARLETGIAQPEALGLYRALGYVERTPFGGYRSDPLSVFMEKRLDE